MEALGTPPQNRPVLWKKDSFFDSGLDIPSLELPFRKFYQKYGKTKIHCVAPFHSKEFLLQMKSDWEDFQKISGTGEFLIQSQLSQKLLLIKNGKISRCFVSKYSLENHVSFMMKYSFSS
jgi:hypothetical protein